MIAILSQQGNPLMPTKRHKKVRQWLAKGHAKIVSRLPFTVQLQFETGTETQPITLGVDSGYTYIGFSVLTEKEELYGGELTLLAGIKNRLKDKLSYRRTRRARLRYRKPGFLTDTKGKDWLAPSVQHKLDSHLKLIRAFQARLPITKTTVEVANFDIQKIKNASISGREYQEGEQQGFSDLREYILHRDNHQCQSEKCISKRKKKTGNPTKNVVLQVHHLGYWKKDSSNRPSNLITLCTGCHTSIEHQKSGALFGWEPKLKGFKEATFMSMVRWKLVNALNCEHTYGTQTKEKRSRLALEKSHHNDAFVIANGTVQKRCQPMTIIQKRKNNRSLEKFYDAKYVDLRNGKKRSGKELSSQRRKRTREHLPENLRQYRAHKVSKGRRSIRQGRSAIQPKDIVCFEGKLYSAMGMQNKGAYLKMTDGINKPRVKNLKDIDIIFHQKSFVMQ